MGMAPLGTVDRIGLHFHPGQGAVTLRGLARRREVLREGVAVPEPLAPCVRALRAAEGLARAGLRVDELEAEVGVGSVAQDPAPVAGGGNVPRIDAGHLTELAAV